MALPTHYRGLWRREGIWRSDGSSDTTTQVLWFQSARWHIDSRGFAGTTVVEGERCEWHPEIAWPAPGPDLDAGTMRFDGAGGVEETGIDGSYREQWLRIDAGPIRALRLRDDSGALACLIAGDNWLAWAHGRRADPASEFTFARRDGECWLATASNSAGRAGQDLGRDADRDARLLRVGDVASMPLAAGGAWRVVEVDD